MSSSAAAASQAPSKPAFRPSPIANRVGDALLVLGASLFASMWHLKAGLITGLAALILWSFGARVLRHYDVGRSFNRPLADLALTSVLVLGVVASMLVGGWISTRYAQTIDLRAMLAVLWPGALWLRVMFALVGRVAAYGPPDEVLVLGIGALGRITGLEIRDDKKNRRKVFGFLSFPDETKHTRLVAPLMGTTDDLEHVLRTHAFNEVYVAGNAIKHATVMQQVIRVCERYGVPFALPASHFRFDRARPTQQITGGYVHYLTYENKPFQMGIKRFIDIVASTIALVLLSPLLVTIAVLVKLGSRGPIFFKQLRVGRYGAPFFMLKFRSMVINAEELKAKLEAQNEQTGPVFKMKHDPRITRIGRFIRKFSIDELPQLINVLRGEMSIVGPRPPIPSEVDKYEPWQRRRLSVAPGLTCVWQVSGRNEISFKDWMYLDMQYIDHWTLKGDLQLILKTVPVVLLGKGAS
jgi:exopolysaccharide biosynthesis polyprenyl glycosylphosphotransferase